MSGPPAPRFNGEVCPKCGTTERYLLSRRCVHCAMAAVSRGGTQAAARRRSGVVGGVVGVMGVRESRDQIKTVGGVGTLGEIFVTALCRRDAEVFAARTHTWHTGGDGNGDDGEVETLYKPHRGPGGAVKVERDDRRGRGAPWPSARPARASKIVMLRMVSNRE